MRTLLFDIETDGLLEAVKYIHCLVVYDPEKDQTWRFHAQDSWGWEGYITDGLRMLMEADVIVGHNIVRFDIPVIQKFYPWFKPRGKVRDTLIISRLAWPNMKSLDKGSPKVTGKMVGSHALKVWGLRLNALKGDYAETTDWKNFTPELLEYCVQDVKGPTLALWNLIQKKQYSERAIQIEHDFVSVMEMQEKHGFRFDLPAAQKLHAQLVKRKLELEAQLQAKYKGWVESMKTPEYWVASWRDLSRKAATKGEAETLLWPIVKVNNGRRKEMTFTAGPLATKHTPFSPSSRHHIIRVLTEEHGWKPSKFTDGGDPQLDEEILERLDIPEAKLLIEYLMIEKRLGMLAEGDNAWLKLVKNGRIHHRVNHMGTVTSRVSHEKPNLGQVVAVDKPFGKEFRALFLPDEGHVLVGCDAAGIQLRVIAHYASRWDGGAYATLVTTGDIHTANQKAAGLPTRANAKTFIYSWLLGAGPGKTGSIIGKGPKEGREIQEKFLAGFPALKQLKEELNRRARETGFIKGLDGRLMPCENGHLAMGSLLQGFEAVVMKWATYQTYLEFTKRGWVHGVDYGYCAMVHDELQISAKPEIADELGKIVVECIRRAGDEFGSRCPLDGEYKIGANWCETH